MNLLVSLVVGIVFMCSPAYAENGHNKNRSINNSSINSIQANWVNQQNFSARTDLTLGVEMTGATTNISVPANVKELPNIPTYVTPQMIEYRGPYEMGIAGKVKPWKEQKEWTKAEIEAYYSQFDSASCIVYKHRDVAKVELLIVMASNSPVIAYLECNGESDFSIWGTAAKKALEVGGSFIDERAYAVTYSNKATGWNIGIGGGVTSIGSADYSRGGSVGGGTGFGSVETMPVAKIKAVFVVR